MIEAIRHGAGLTHARLNERVENALTATGL
jgi:hypothetical protein